MFTDFKPLESALQTIPKHMRFGRIISIKASFVQIEGLSLHARIGDQVFLQSTGPTSPIGEIISITKNSANTMLYDADAGLRIGGIIGTIQSSNIRPSSGWMGRVIDAFGRPIDGRSLSNGTKEVSVLNAPPNAMQRRMIGNRITTSIAVFNTVLPIAKGQRIGIFAGSGVGKSTLMAELARGVDCDVVVIALIGERGRELREFTETVLGETGMKKSVIIAATSDQSPLIKRRAAWTATAVAEYFRDQGLHVLLLMDSITRFAEAHREVALTAGETPSLRAFPPSTASQISGLAERSGPGLIGSGDITAVYTVLVSGSDMEEPIADITRGVLDGHVILDRAIAERGRFPAIDVARSVSRSLPSVASSAENKLISEVRSLLGVYEKAEPMIQSGLYSIGADEKIDRAITKWPALDLFFANMCAKSISQSFGYLSKILNDTQVDHNLD